MRSGTAVYKCPFFLWIFKHISCLLIIKLGFCFMFWYQSTWSVSLALLRPHYMHMGCYGSDYIGCGDRYNHSDNSPYNALLKEPITLIMHFYFPCDFCPKTVRTSPLTLKKRELILVQRSHRWYIYKDGLCPSTWQISNPLVLNTWRISSLKSRAPFRR